MLRIPGLLLALLLLLGMSASQAAETCEDVFARSEPSTSSWFNFFKPKRNSSLYLSDARNGQSETYRLLGRLLKSDQKKYRVHKISANWSWFQIWRIKPGDAVLVNMYSSDPFLESRLATLKKKGVRVFVDVEITAAHHLRVLDRVVKFYKDYTLVTSSQVVADAMKQKWPESEVVVIPHLETLYFHPEISANERPIGKVFSGKQMADPSRKRLLFIHQYHPPGENFARSFFEVVDQLALQDVDIIVALHPHSSAEQVERYEAHYGSRPNVKIVLSSDGIKTNDLFPYIDGVISHSSTLVDVARTLGLPIYDSNYGANFEGLKDFIGHLDVKARAEREKSLQDYSTETLNSWKGLIFEAPEER